jgi:RNA-directed DNA polymerase
MKRLPRSLSAEALRDAWKYSRDSKSGKTPGAPGVDGVRAAVFAGQLSREIADMRHALQGGSYKFSRLRFAPVPKPSGGYRIIAIPTVRDRLLQRTLLRSLEEDSRFNANSPIAYGFTRGRSLADAQRAALGYRKDQPWVLQADIIKFFDQIDRAQLQQLIRRKIRGKTISDLLCDAVCCEIELVGGKGADIIRDNGIQVGRGLRQGMPISPMLSNLLLKSFDEALTKRGLVALRYADDIAVFGKSERELTDALAFISEILGELKLKIPDLEAGGKTTISGPSEVVEFLGVEIRRSGENYTLTAPNRKLEGIEAEMSVMASMAECAKHSRNIGHVVRALDAFIIGHGASMAVLDDPKPFIDRLEAAKQRSLNTLLIELIGKNAVKSLDETRRAILGLDRFPPS